MDTAIIDRDLADLTANKTGWARLDIRSKILLLRDIRSRIGRVARPWVEAASKAKGLDPTSPLVGEEWTSGPWALAENCLALEDTLTRVGAGRDILDGYRISTRPDGRVIIRVFPADLRERLYFSGHAGDVWMEPGVTEADLDNLAATFYRKSEPDGAVTAILGAGNISSIPPMDLLYKLYVEGSVGIVKFNPVNEYLGEFLEEVFAPMVEAGYARFAYGGPDVGEYLTRHDDVDSVHVTGGDRTYDAIVFGAGEDGAARKERDDPYLPKRVTAELGGVGPTIVVPGPWSDRDLRYQAEQIVSQKLHNGGFNCVANQVLVLPQAWPRADRLVDAIRDVVRGGVGRHPYYPGAPDRHDRIVAGYPQAEVLLGPPALVTLITDVDPGDADQLCFTSEFFAPILATTKLPGDTPVKFLANAVSFANEQLLGTLGANLAIHPATARAWGPDTQRMITSLRYGTIAINTWTGIAYAMTRARWGAFPGHDRTAIGSGVGVVHNALMLERTERTVVRGPFTPPPRAFARREFHIEPKPVYFVTHRSAATVGERLTRQAVSGSWRHVPQVLAGAIRG